MTMERDEWAYGGRRYTVTLASTPTTLDLELDDIAPTPSRGLVALASRDDESGVVSLRTFTSSPLPIELVERFIADAVRRLPPG